MAEQAEFVLRGRNPDVLTCIASLSNDEVFTSPEFANQMLDTLADAWADSNDGADIWKDSTVKFLDPVTKSGVFLREVTKRMVEGLAEEIPDLGERVDHVLMKQVYGVGITQLTSLLARRSLYCSKFANGEYSIAESFDTEDGNIWFERTEHIWKGGKCVYCRASQAAFERSTDLETHAYAIIHTNDIKARVAELFGADMQFDVIIGNPPYQIAADEAGQNVMPIYNLFVEQAKKLDPRYLSFVIPSRWMAGGKYLDDFRSAMLNDTRISHLVDYPNSAEMFPSVDIKGGVCYFLRDAKHDGDCDASLVRDGQVIGPRVRKLNEFDVFVRDERAVDILHKVLARQEATLTEIASTRDPFGPALSSNFTGYSLERMGGWPRLYMQGGDRNRWVDPGFISRNLELVDEWKVLMPKAGPGNSGGHVVPDMVLGRPIVAEPNSACTLTYLVVGLTGKVMFQRLARMKVSRSVARIVGGSGPNMAAVSSARRQRANACTGCQSGRDESRPWRARSRWASRSSPSRRSKRWSVTSSASSLPPAAIRVALVLPNPKMPTFVVPKRKRSP